jgi:hypothetical protein
MPYRQNHTEHKMQSWSQIWRYTQLPPRFQGLTCSSTRHTLSTPIGSNGQFSTSSPISLLGPPPPPKKTKTDIKQFCNFPLGIRSMCRQCCGTSLWRFVKKTLTAGHTHRTLTTRILISKTADSKKIASNVTNSCQQTKTAKRNCVFIVKTLHIIMLHVSAVRLPAAASTQNTQRNIHQCWKIPLISLYLLMRQPWLANSPGYYFTFLCILLWWQAWWRPCGRNM